MPAICKLLLWISSSNFVHHKCHFIRSSFWCAYQILPAACIFHRLLPGCTWNVYQIIKTKIKTIIKHFSPCWFEDIQHKIVRCKRCHVNAWSKLFYYFIWRLSLSFIIVLLARFFKVKYLCAAWIHNEKLQQTQKKNVNTSHMNHCDVTNH